VNPRGIQEDELTSLYMFDAENPVPCGLGFFSNDGNFIPEETVEEGRLSYIGSSQD
jgi:hypothetical protein